MALVAEAPAAQLAFMVTRAVVLSIIVAGLVMFGLPAVLALGAAHP